MFVMWSERGRVHPVQQTLLFCCVPCNVRAEREALDAYEGITRIGGSHAGCILRETPTGK